METPVTSFTFWCAAGSWSSREVSLVWVAPPHISWVVSPDSDPEHRAPMAEEEARIPELLEEVEEHKRLLVEVGGGGDHSLEVGVVEEVGLQLLVMEEGEEEQCHQGEDELLNLRVEEGVVEELALSLLVVVEVALSLLVMVEEVEVALSRLVMVEKEVGVVEEPGWSLLLIVVVEEGVPQSEEVLLLLQGEAEVEEEAAADMNSGNHPAWLEAVGSRCLHPTHYKAL